MGFFAKVKAWFVGEEATLAAEIHDAIAWVKPRFEAYAKVAEEIFANAAVQFFKQAGPLIAQAAQQAIDSGLKGVDVRDFAKSAILPIAKTLAVDAEHKLIDSFLNTTIELNHQEEVAP